MRKRAAQTVKDLCSKYAAEFVDWVDTGEGTEKQAVVLRLQIADRPVVLVAWRGSKSRVDWTTTDANLQFVRLQPARATAGGGSRSASRSRGWRGASRSTDATASLPEACDGDEELELGSESSDSDRKSVV